MVPSVPISRSKRVVRPSSTARLLPIGRGQWKCVAMKPSAFTCPDASILAATAQIFGGDRDDAAVLDAHSGNHVEARLGIHDTTAFDYEVECPGRVRGSAQSGGRRSSHGACNQIELAAVDDALSHMLLPVFVRIEWIKAICF